MWQRKHHRRRQNRVLSQAAAEVLEDRRLLSASGPVSDGVWMDLGYPVQSTGQEGSGLWNGSGTMTARDTGGSGRQSDGHQYTSGGIYTVIVTVRD